MPSPFITEVEALGTQAWGDLTALAVKEEAAAIAVFAPIFTSVIPAELAILADLFVTAKADYAAGKPVGDILTDVFNKATGEELALLQKLDSQLLTAIATLFAIAA